MHALQVLPLLAAVLATAPRRLLDDTARLRLVPGHRAAAERAEA